MVKEFLKISGAALFVNIKTYVNRAGKCEVKNRSMERAKWRVCIALTGTRKSLWIYSATFLDVLFYLQKLSTLNFQDWIFMSFSLSLKIFTSPVLLFIN